MRHITLAAIQMSCSPRREENIEKAVAFVRGAAKQGGQVILLPELFETQYFCQERNYEYYRLATPLSENPAVRVLREEAKRLRVVLPVSFFEAAGQTNFNSVAMIDADGEILGLYRKTHIPDDHFYQEKFYFTPGDTGFKVFDTAYGKVGCGICWDQWFPESAREMALKGAEMLLYPTAIGSEPILGVDSAGFRPPLAAVHAGARGGEPDAAYGRQPDRRRVGLPHRRQPEPVLHPHLLRLFVYRRRDRRDCRGRAAGSGMRPASRVRPGRHPGVPFKLGQLPRPAAGNV